MLLNEYGIYQMVKMREEETDRRARDAWKYQGLFQESVFQKAGRTWNSRQALRSLQQTDCCPSQC